MTSETIVAIATPIGRGGIGVVRLSGADALRIARSITSLRIGPEPQRAYYTHVQDDDGAVLDDALLTYFAAPRSYTGEDVVEISTHGSPVVLQTVVEQSKRAGARLAHSGEFTERAFLNGKLDLTAAEAVRDLIDSSTVAQARLAAEQLCGSLQREVRPVKDALVHLIATLEAGIDFAEDDIDTADNAALLDALDGMEPPLHNLLQSFAYGRVVREGLRLAIVGRPNAGKSSLFNRLLERERAIVTPIAGTTRDVVSERAIIGGLPVELLDTAGLRDATDPIERIGIARSHEAMADADVVLRVIDATAADTSASLLATCAGATLTVYNKADLLPPELRDSLPSDAMVASAVTGEGMEAVRAAIVRQAGGNRIDAAHATLTNLRQRESIEQTLLAVQRARQSTGQGMPHEMVLLDLYEALHALDALTGQTTSDDILHTIFSSFCIGK